MKIAVTGAGGFIGRNLIQRLQGRHEIVPLGRKWTDPGLIGPALQGVEAVIHLGGIKGRDSCERNVGEAIAVNIEGTRLLAEAARKAGVARFLFASTYGVYGRRTPSELPSREESGPRPADLYSLTKAWGERLVHEGLPTSTVLRLGHVYGLGSNMAGRPDVTLKLFRSAREEGLLRVRGSGRTSIDPIWIGDLCECIRLLLERVPSGRETFNIASGSPLTIRELAETIRSHVKGLGIQARVVQEGPDDPTEFDRIPDVRRILETLRGFSPRPLSEGLKELTTEKCHDLLPR